MPTEAPKSAGVPEHEAMPEGEEPPPRGAATMAIVRWTILGLAAVVAGGAWWSFARPASTPATTAMAPSPKYRCPMHPQVVSDEPGECPICHMTLVPIAAPVPSSAPSAPASGTIPPGTAPLTLSLDRIQSIGVRTAVATDKTLAHGLRVTGVVAAPEQGAAEVHVRTTGFVETILVGQTGIPVAAGQALFTMYSPEIYQAESELLTTAKWAAGDSGARASDPSRKKLELLGMAPADIDHVLQTGEPLRRVPVYAPLGGYVVKKSVVLGSNVTPEMTLYEIQDLSSVYITADVFQRDMDEIHTGLAGRFVAASGVTADGKVDLVYPQINAEARTTRVRMQVRNPKTQLRPGQYGNVELDTKASHAVFVPRDAVIDTGQVAYVFLVEEGGHFTPRIVTLGEAEGDDVAITSGLAGGDRVVSGATFLIDSESRLQGSITPAPGAPAPPASEGGP